MAITNALFEALLMIVSLTGAMKLFTLRDRPGLDFACAALLIVVAATLLGAIRYGGVSAPMLVAAHETVSLMATILAPSWVIACIVVLLRGEPGKAALAVLWLLPAIVVPLGVAEATAEIGSIYAQMAGLVMMVLMLAAGVMLAVRGSAAAGAAFVLGSAGYAGAALSIMGFFGLSASAAMDLYHASLSVWAAGLAFGALAVDAIKRRDTSHSQ